MQKKDLLCKKLVFSIWQLVHESLERAKVILENNQYPPRFYEKIIHDTLTKIVEASPSKRKSKKNNS